jgi:hypothetical protein
MGRTPIGRATIAVLNPNMQLRVDHNRSLIDEGVWVIQPPKTPNQNTKLPIKSGFLGWRFVALWSVLESASIARVARIPKSALNQ